MSERFTVTTSPHGFGRHIFDRGEHVANVFQYIVLPRGSWWFHGCKSARDINSDGGFPSAEDAIAAFIALRIEATKCA